MRKKNSHQKEKVQDVIFFSISGFNTVTEGTHTKGNKKKKKIPSAQTIRMLDLKFSIYYQNGLVHLPGLNQPT